MDEEQQQQDWRESLPEEIRTSPAIKDFNDVGALAKSYLETKSMVGKSIRIPGEDAGEEDWKQFNERLAEKVPGLVRMPGEDDEEGLNALWTKLGRPVTDEGYTPPEGVEPTPEMVQAAKELGLTNKQYQAYVKREATRQNDAYEAAKAEQEASKAEVLGEWGAAKEQKLKQIRIMLESTGAPDPVKEVMNDLNVDGSFLRWAETIVESLKGEATTFGNDDVTERNIAVTPQEAAVQISEILNNPSHPFHNRSDPSHKLALQRMVDLHDYKAGRQPQNKI